MCACAEASSDGFRAAVSQGENVQRSLSCSLIKEKQKQLSRRGNTKRKHDKLSSEVHSVQVLEVKLTGGFSSRSFFIKVRIVTLALQDVQ